MPASPTSWKRQPFKEGVSIPYQATFESEQFSCLKEGLIPREMEDKWFIYYEEPHLFLHRSWTGQPVYRVELKHTANGAEVIEALLSKDLASAAEGLDYQAALVDFLISNLLLRQHKPFPVASGLTKSEYGIFQHHISGTGYPSESTPHGEGNRINRLFVGTPLSNPDMVLLSG
jgi:hypothetical protein